MALTPACQPHLADLFGVDFRRQFSQPLPLPRSSVSWVSPPNTCAIFSAGNGCLKRKPRQSLSSRRMNTQRPPQFISCARLWEGRSFLAAVLPRDDCVVGIKVIEVEIRVNSLVSGTSSRGTRGQQGERRTVAASKASPTGVRPDCPLTRAFRMPRNCPRVAWQLLVRLHPCAVRKGRRTRRVAAVSRAVPL